MNFINNIYLLIIVASIIFLSCRTQEDDSKNRTAAVNKFDFGQLNPDAPIETQLLGQFAGLWAARQSIRQQDGSWSDQKKSSLWRWYYILDGHAVQDDWITMDSLNQQQVVGTNIRIYNADENRWYMSWIDKTNRKLATFTAINDGDKVIMDGTNAKGRRVRNTFYNIKPNEFDWKQEWTFDEGNSWVEVTKIHCEK